MLTIIQSEWEPRPTADTLPTDENDHKLIGQDADCEEILEGMWVDPAKEPHSVSLSFSERHSHA